VEPHFLSFEQVIKINRDQVERYGGSLGVRDSGLLQSAVAAPAASFDGKYLHEDLAAMAAAYLFSIVRNHPFIDGNKRTAAVAAIVFLTLNGRDLEADQAAFENTVMAIAQGKMQKEELTRFIRKNISPLG
jgi:death on curing protein